jgi:serine/threonine protein phosphatase 1
VAAPFPCDSEPFGRLIRARRVWAVASVHGEAGRLANLHEALAERFQQGDRLIYLGDVLGYGPDSAGAVDGVLSFRRAVLAERQMFLGDVVLLRGSQEEMCHKLLELQFAPDPRSVLSWMLDHGVAQTLESYGVDTRAGQAASRDGVMALTRWTGTLRAALEARGGHRHYLAALRRAAFTEPGGTLYVNAGVDPRKPLELQRDVFWWGRGGDLLALDAPFAGFARVVCGYHRARAGLIERPYAVSLDAGCGFGGPLMAACFSPDGEILERIEA